MRILLDTHVWLWWLIGDKRLKKTHADLIRDPHSELFLSPISVWEAHLLLESERLDVSSSDPARWIESALEVLPIRQAQLTFAIAARARTLSLAHQDPADRFIAATAAEMKVPLLTADKRLLACKNINCI